jgi:hypothetical protein
VLHPLAHSKLVVCDEKGLLVGSANLPPYALSTNLERGVVLASDAATEALAVVDGLVGTRCVYLVSQSSRPFSERGRAAGRRTNYVGKRRVYAEAAPDPRREVFRVVPERIQQFLVCHCPRAAALRRLLRPLALPPALRVIFAHQLQVQLAVRETLAAEH